MWLRMMGNYIPHVSMKGNCCLFVEHAVSYPYPVLCDTLAKPDNQISLGVSLTKQLILCAWLDGNEGERTESKVRMASGGG